MKRNLLILGLIMVLVVLTGATYAYWDKLSDVSNEVINVGEGTSITVSAVATAPVGKVLVPNNILMGVNDVDEIILTYNVKLTKEALTAPNLTVTASNILIDSVNTYSDLVNIVISQGAATVNNADVLVTVSVTLTEPGDSTIYNAIINKTLTFDLTFTGASA